MAACGLAVHQAPCFNCGFLRVSISLDNDPSFFRPLTGFLLGIRIQNVRKQRFQQLIRFKFAHDLLEECLRNWARMGENADGNLRIAENVLDSFAPGNDCGLVMFTSPQVKMPIRMELHFHASVEAEVAIHVRTPQDHRHQVEQVIEA